MQETTYPEREICLTLWGHLYAAGDLFARNEQHAYGVTFCCFLHDRYFKPPNCAAV